MATYSLDVKLQDVDLITGVQVKFAPKIKGSRGGSFSAEVQTPSRNGTANFKLMGPRDGLTGKLIVEAAQDRSGGLIPVDSYFVDKGITYNFIAPDSRSVKFSGGNRSQAITIDLSKASPRSAIASANNRFEAETIFEVVTAIDPLA